MKRQIYIAIFIASIILLLVITAFCVLVNEGIAAEKPDTTISVSVEKITQQIVAKQEHLKQVQAEIAKLDSYRKELDMEATGTFYQIDALTKLKQEADTLTTKKGRK